MMEHEVGGEGARRMRPLDRGEALSLLGTVPLGRVVFTRHALPAVRPVNHLLDGEDIVLRVHDGGALAALAAPCDGAGVVVAYETDDIDARTRLGWSVVVTGYARPVTDPAQAAAYEDRLRPWVLGPEPCRVVRIRPDLVTGFRLEHAAAPPPGAAGSPYAALVEPGAAPCAGSG
ncbi:MULTISPECIES: pyridoxamine 5'-phosphate oxidase family protein [unclassified Streptomyces]|uniref:pyridoxamine 5'-phosphate oxidase family protein n=1 Tax=unclassified Streptomyces TaxID=2593676 RepID=UPI0036A404C1